MSKTIKFDIRNICSNKGYCLLSAKNGEKYGEDWCFGNGNSWEKDFYGTAHCPLADKFAEITIKDDWEEEIKKTLGVK